MIEIFDFGWVFPTWGSLGVWCLGLAAGLIYSFMANEQSVANKRRNAFKYALAVSFFGAVTITAQIMNGEPERAHHVTTIMLLVWAFMVLGDWIAFLLRKWHFHPGGAQGWWWSNVIYISRKTTATAIAHYAEIIDPAEARLLEMAADAIDPGVLKTAEIIAVKTAQVVVPKIKETIVEVVGNTPVVARVAQEGAVDTEQHKP